MEATEWDVATIGAGPVGLALSLGLAQAGRSVLVLEKADGLSEHSRAPIIWPRTQEIFSALGVLSRFEAEGTVRSQIRLWDADHKRVLLRFPIEELRGATPFPRMLFCPQSRTERILYEALADEPSADVRFSAEVANLRQVEGAVEVRFRQDGEAQTATAAVAAGCDGAHSQVRDTVASAFVGRTYDAQAALADLTFDREQDGHVLRLTHQQGVTTAIRIDDRLWRLVMPQSSAETVPLDARIERAAARLFPTADHETVWTSTFSLHRRVSSCFAKGRIVLAGDAAHVTSPVGGQGMNLGLQDAAALANALNRSLKQRHLKPLVGYASERRDAVGTGAVWATDQLTQVLLAGRGGSLVPFLRLFGFVLRFGPVRHAIMRRMAMLDDPSRRRSLPGSPLT